MASEKQTAANRVNAKRSTGPRSAIRKMNSSRNAYRHGLSCPLLFDHAVSERVEAIARLLVDDGTSEQQLTAAAEFAEAQLINEKIDLHLCDIRELRRLAALNRSERLAHTRRRRASYKLNVQDEGDREGI